MRRTASARGAVPMFFVVGHAKSGTSWLMRLLDAHPDVVCRGEGKFFGRESPRSLHGALSCSEELQTWLRSNPWVHDRPNAHRELVRFVVNGAMKDRLQRSGAEIVGDKTPLVTPDIVEEINATCPEATVVHIVRDGRDVAVSGVHHAWNNATDSGGRFELSAQEKAARDAYRSDPAAFVARGESIFADRDVVAGSRQWNERVRRAMLDGAARRDHYHQIRYEDLLEDPVGELGGVLDRLGVDSSSARARECVEAASFERLAGRDRGREDSTSFYRKGVSGDWQAHFDEEHRRIFKREAGELLIRLGYEDDHAWAEASRLPGDLLIGHGSDSSW